MYHKYTQEQINQTFVNIGTISITWGRDKCYPNIFLYLRTVFWLLSWKEENNKMDETGGGEGVYEY